jgi:hypothetical protein
VWDDDTHVRPFTIRGFRRLFVDQGFEIDVSGHESVMAGTSIVSRRTMATRRPLPYRVAARTPLIRRNVWMLARAPDS